jgi:hypothetical protein
VLLRRRSAHRRHSVPPLRCARARRARVRTAAVSRLAR